jgi:hypothetical protein
MCVLLIVDHVEGDPGEGRELEPGGGDGPPGAELQEGGDAARSWPFLHISPKVHTVLRVQQLTREDVPT